LGEHGQYGKGEGSSAVGKGFNLAGCLALLRVMQKGPKLSFGVFHTAPSLFGQSVPYLFIGARSDIIGVADPSAFEQGEE
jgi:hypothetical protein